MKVLKFGGTSVGSANRMKELVKLVKDQEQCIIVLSAMSGTTNNLVNITACLYKKKHDKANILINNLEQDYISVVSELFSTASFLKKGNELIKAHFNFIRSFTNDLFTLFEEKAILAQGELLSTALLHFYCEEQGVDSVLIPALNFMRIDKENEPDSFYIQENLKREITSSPANIYITQGYICRNAFGEIDNLKRGGSDFSASLIGVAIIASEIQIWTDIDGMHNNDPRFVNQTFPISELSFDEAAELAYFGAKILHPSSILPAKLANIPVRLKNTLQPTLNGTLISSKQSGTGIKAIAAKDGITTINIKSGRMLLAHGFMRKVFEIFETYSTSIDMVTTSEVAISITIDDVTYLKQITEELNNYGNVTVNKNLSIICVVGDFIAETKGYALKIFNSLENISIKMISYGASDHNVSILVNTSDKKEALNALNQNIF